MTPLFEYKQFSFPNRCSGNDIPILNKSVIPPVPACRGTGAQRSGGTCCFVGPHADLKAAELMISFAQVPFPARLCS
jgi:hypothetical protein